MFEVIVGLALLPVALVVGFYLLAMGLGAIWFLGGWLLAAFGLLLMFNAVIWPGVICLFLGMLWGFGVAKRVMQ